MDRITLLEAEIARVKTHHARAADRRKVADALFSGGCDSSDSGGGSAAGPAPGAGG